ncbi:MgtC/SapB family protein [Paenisporosarcina cavernae]|uniref:MgtC/SapB family protein n=1 Tax=Paenisporosarcina cavernae TaxID=2320858 RepID=A0A385YW65_9BACL|nr:MgtC/SapB family protein [Paenisporosarcina cavernae]AYC29928.1 MgtC/SapB family protein [Paenisporosarcina cavernae]
MELLDWVNPADSILFKLSLAALLSLIIGLERELKRKPVGLKTSLVISTFSCLLTYISIEAAYSATGSNSINITMDPLRLAAQIVSGIGFLGAGVILRKGNDSITGLTTAAMIWGAGAIGIAVGAGFYLEAAACVLIVLIGIEIIPPLLIKFGPRRLRMKEISLVLMIKNNESINSLFDYLKSENMFLDNVKIKDVTNPSDSGKKQVDLKVSTLPNKTIQTLYASFRQLEYVDYVEIELLN